MRLCNQNTTVQRSSGFQTFVSFHRRTCPMLIRAKPVQEAAVLSGKTWNNQGSPSQRVSFIIHLKQHSALYCFNINYSLATGNHFNGHKRSVEPVQLVAFIMRKRGKDNAFSLLKSPLLRKRKTRTENRHQSFVELVVCDLQVLNYGLSPSLPLQAF